MSDAKRDFLFLVLKYFLISLVENSKEQNKKSSFFLLKNDENTLLKDLFLGFRQVFSEIMILPYRTKTLK
jgi:hypothetical protein